MPEDDASSYLSDDEINVSKRGITRKDSRNRIGCYYGFQNMAFIFVEKQCT